MLVILKIMWWALVAIAVTFSVFGLDGLFFDLCYIYYNIRRFIIFFRAKPLTYEKLREKPEQKVAIIVACWQEEDVIYDMLRHNAREIDYDNYTIFVGVYPNDPDTIKEVRRAEQQFNHICCVIGPDPGPSSKAANLNVMYKHILEEEQRTNTHYDIMVIHDSEDMIHGLSLKLYNYLLPRKDMIQIPIFPLEVGHSNFTHWVYNDEFAEVHVKNMIVREFMGGFVTSAGVGTAFSRKTIDALARANPNKVPFVLGRLTEDYNVSLQVRLLGLKSIFVTQAILRTSYRKNWLGHLKLYRIKEHVATRALFPMEYSKSIRQKARWVTGIAFQEWAETGWKGDFVTRYNLFIDRKSSFTLLFNGAGYFIFLFWVFYSWWQFYHPQYPSLQDYFNRYPWTWFLVIVCTLMMFDRMLFRMFATWKIYGFVAAILSIPRLVYGNILNMHALLRAYRQFFFRSKNNKQMKWDKTDHIFRVASSLQPSNKRLGDFLVEKGYITSEACVQLISEQHITGERLGELLLRKGIVSESQLLQVMAEQYNLEFMPKTPAALARKRIPGMSFGSYRWLLKQRVIPVSFDKAGVLTLAIHDPSNSAKLGKIEKKLAAYQIKFVISPRINY